ncbi:MAG: sensor histidine kinase [Myxococcales bacterium]
MPATRKAASPGISATHAARRIALYALYSGPVVFLLATAVLVVGLWKGWNSGGLLYLAVAALAGLGSAFGYVLQRRLRDISQALERAQRTSTVGLLTAGFAHEMKNALTVILGFAELSRTGAERANVDAKVARHLRELENETRRTVAQLQSFLSYSAGERVPWIPRDVNELVRESLTMVRPMARMKELLVEESTGDPPRVSCDPFAVRQMLLNLLLNALDFARTRIVVTTSRSAEGDAEVIVADDGPGVPPQDRKRIFQRFVTTRAGGNGLGLTTSREIAEAHGGSLTLLDSSPGATFAVRLPAAATQEVVNRPA